MGPDEKLSRASVWKFLNIFIIKAKEKLLFIIWLWNAYILRVSGRIFLSMLVYYCRWFIQQHDFLIEIILRKILLHKFLMANMSFINFNV